MLQHLQQVQAEAFGDQFSRKVPESSENEVPTYDSGRGLGFLKKRAHQDAADQDGATKQDPKELLSQTMGVVVGMPKEKVGLRSSRRSKSPELEPRRGTAALSFEQLRAGGSSPLDQTGDEETHQHKERARESIHQHLSPGRKAWHDDNDGSDSTRIPTWTPSLHKYDPFENRPYDREAALDGNFDMDELSPALPLRSMEDIDEEEDEAPPITAPRVDPKWGQRGRPGELQHRVKEQEEEQVRLKSRMEAGQRDPENIDGKTINAPEPQAKLSPEERKRLATDALRRRRLRRDAEAAMGEMPQVQQQLTEAELAGKQGEVQTLQARKRELENRIAAAEEPQADCSQDAAVVSAKTSCYEGSASGKYQWADSNKDSKPADDIQVGDAIRKYSFADGKRAVSVYVELDGLDAVSDDALKANGCGREASLTITAIGKPPRLRRLALSGLRGEILGVQLVRKPGKNTVVLQWWKSWSGSMAKERVGQQSLRAEPQVAAEICWQKSDKRAVVVRKRARS